MLMYEMIMFCNKFTTCMSMSTTTGRNLRVVFNYCMTCVSITKRHVIALLYHYALAIVVEAIIGRRPRRNDGDQGVEPVTMEIMMMLWIWRSKARDGDGHIISHILIACDVYPLCILFFLE